MGPTQPRPGRALVSGDMLGALTRAGLASNFPAKCRTRAAVRCQSRCVILSQLTRRLTVTTEPAVT